MSKRLSFTVGARRSASSAGLARSFSALLVLSAALEAQRVAVSTTDDVPTAGAFSVSDGDLVAVEAGQPIEPHFLGGHFLASTGFTPGDIDAFTRLAGPRPGSADSIVFSLLSNEGGFLDGDVIALTQGAGAALLLSELDLTTALGMPGENIDVDALSFDDQGRLLFSLNTDHVSATLGPVADGDILRLEPGLAGVTRLYSEADVQARFTLATGLTDAILDVQALEWAGGEMWCAVQAPSRHDGSVLRLAGTPAVVLDETTLGLGGAEIDALGPIRAGDELPCFRIGPAEALPGDTIHVEAHGAPSSILLVLMAGRSGYVDYSRIAGFGGWYLDRTDPWLRGLMAAGRVPIAVLDGSGAFQMDWALPPGTEYGVGMGGEQGWSFQVLDVSTATLSAPFRVRRL